MEYTYLHLVRHGLTQGNVEGRYTGSGSDLALCTEGRAQLEDLKSRFTYPNVQVVLISPLLRARQTAEILFPGARLIALQDLREMHFGCFEGKSPQELANDPLYADWLDPEKHVTPPGAEESTVFVQRTCAMLMKMFEFLLKAHIHEAACVTHGGVIMNMLASHALPLRSAEQWMTDPGAGYSLRCDAAMWMRDQFAEVYDVVPAGYLDSFTENKET